MRLEKAMMGQGRAGGEEQKPWSQRRQRERGGEREVLRGGRQPRREDLASLRSR